jgi:CheY-like chemotaxis protein
MKDVHILLVEDNEGDILLTKEALLDAKINNEVTVARDGEVAINYLESTLKESAKNLPDLILLDINLPKLNGQEVLQFVKSHTSFKRIPVVILTTSSSDLDVVDAYNNHANCFITKPVDLNKFFEVVRKIQEFWTAIVTLPAKQ